jgi:hypothetical protein
VTAIESRLKAPAPQHDPTVAPELRHVMFMERSYLRLAWAGLVSAFVITLSFLGVSAWLIHDNHGLAGTILATVDLVALVTVFIIGKPHQ